MIGWRFGAVVPAPDAVAAVGHPRGWRAQQRPINGPAHIFRGMRFLRMIAEMLFVGRFQSDERPVRQFGPVIGQRTLREPAQGLVIIPVAALVADKAEPFLFAEFLP